MLETVEMSLQHKYADLSKEDYMAAVPFIPAKMFCYIATLGLKAHTQFDKPGPHPSPYMSDVLFDYSQIHCDQPPAD